MNSTEKEISYQSTNSYSTLNTLNTKTKNVWLVFHGMSYLSRYFLKYFKTQKTILYHSTKFKIIWDRFHILSAHIT